MQHVITIKVGHLNIDIDGANVCICSCRLQAAVYYRIYKMKHVEAMRAKLTLDKFCMNDAAGSDSGLKDALRTYVTMSDMLQRCQRMNEKADEFSTAHHGTAYMSHTYMI